MAKPDVQKFVGLLVSDEEFAKQVAENFDRTVREYGIALDKREAIVLKEGRDVYLKEAVSPISIVGPGVAAVPAAAAVGAAVAGSVAGNIATKVADKLMSGKVITPMNARIRELMVHKGILTNADFSKW